MMSTPVNQRTVTLKLKRIEVADLILAMTVLKHRNPDTVKWGLLHDKLKEILDDFDAKNPA